MRPACSGVICSHHHCASSVCGISVQQQGQHSMHCGGTAAIHRRAGSCYGSAGRQGRSMTRANDQQKQRLIITSGNSTAHLRTRQSHMRMKPGSVPPGCSSAALSCVPISHCTSMGQPHGHRQRGNRKGGNSRGGCEGGAVVLAPHAPSCTQPSHCRRRGNTQHVCKP